MINTQGLSFNSADHPLWKHDDVWRNSRDNPISLIIPCHRVVGTNGRLTGYAGGIDRKEKL